MTAKVAYGILKKAYPGKKATSCYEYDTLFAFVLVSKDHDSVKPILSSVYSVDKTNGKIGIFSPKHIPLDEYRKGKKITNFE